MEINSKIHIEQLAPSGVRCQRSDEHDGQTDKQKKTQRFLAAPTAGEIQTWHRARSCTSKTFWGPTHSFTTTGCGRFARNPDTINLKPP